MGSLTPISKGQITASEIRTDLETQAQQILGPDRLTMLFANPNSELFLAMLARAVVFLISGRSQSPEKSVMPSQGFDPAKCSPAQLLDIRNQKV